MERPNASKVTAGNADRIVDEVKAWLVYAKQSLIDQGKDLPTWLADPFDVEVRGGAAASFDTPPNQVPNRSLAITGSFGEKPAEDMLLQVQGLLDS